MINIDYEDNLFAQMLVNKYNFEYDQEKSLLASMKRQHEQAVEELSQETRSLRS